VTNSQDELEGHNPEATARPSKPTQPTQPNASAASVHPHNVSQAGFGAQQGGKVKFSFGLLAIFFTTIRKLIGDANLQPMIQTPIGDQVIELLDQRANATKDPVKKANFLKAKSICKKFKASKGGSKNSSDAEEKQSVELAEALHRDDTKTSNDDSNNGANDDSNDEANDDLDKQRCDFFKKIHHVDINPHSLAVEWLIKHASDWSIYVLGRWRMLMDAISERKEARARDHRMLTEQGGRQRDVSSRRDDE
jgi:hypothetical protein